MSFIQSATISLFLAFYLWAVSYFKITFFNSSFKFLTSLLRDSSFFYALWRVFFTLFSSAIIASFSSPKTVLILLFLFVYDSSFVLSLIIYLFYSRESLNLSLYSYSSVTSCFFYSLSLGIWTFYNFYIFSPLSLWSFSKFYILFL